MYVADLTFPGRNLLPLEGDGTAECEALLRRMAVALGDAAVALELFEQAGRELTIIDQRRRAAQSNPTPQPSESPLKQIRELQESGMDPLQAILELDRRAKHAAWQRGAWPRGYKGRLVFIHARTFVLALHTLHKLLKTIDEEQWLPPSAAQEVAAFRTVFAALPEVRDSVPHLEDRNRYKQASLAPKPVDSTSLRTAGALVVEGLEGNKFVSTARDGGRQEVEVNRRSLQLAHATVQAVINAFSWEGMPHHEPT